MTLALKCRRVGRGVGAVLAFLGLARREEIVGIELDGRGSVAGDAMAGCAGGLDREAP